MACSNGMCGHLQRRAARERTTPDPFPAGGACEVKDALWQLAVDQVLVKLVDSETQVGL